MLTADKFKRVGYTKEEAERIDRPTISYWQDAWRRLTHQCDSSFILSYVSDNCQHFF